MTILYVTEQGATVGLRGRTVVVRLEGADLAEVELHRLRSVLLFGNIQFSTQAARALLREGVEMAFLSFGGQLEGQLTPPLSRNAGLRLTQYQVFGDPARRFPLARALVAAKVANASAVLRQADWDDPVLDLRDACQELDADAARALEVPDEPRLLGLEGMAARRYFSRLGLLLKAPGFTFTGRSKRPPRDPVNALLSFGYTLLASRLQSLLDASGWDPYLGFFHREAWGRPSLALDLLEACRAPVVDRFVLKTLNLRILKPDDFDNTPEDGTRMTPAALKVFLKRWHEHFEAEPMRKTLRHGLDQLAGWLDGSIPPREVFPLFQAR